jgi:hypothetical protein
VARVCWLAPSALRPAKQLSQSLDRIIGHQHPQPLGFQKPAELLRYRAQI